MPQKSLSSLCLEGRFAAKLLRVVIVVAAFGYNFSARAQSPVSDPVKDLLSQSDLGTVSEIEASSSVLRMSIDVLGRGKPCIFLALSDSYGRSVGFLWTVYVPVKGGYMKAKPAEENASVRCLPERIYVGAISEVGGHRGIVTYSVAHGSGGIDAYWIKGKTLVHKEIGTFAYPEEGSNPDGTITNVPMLLKYFPGVSKPYFEEKDQSERLLFDDLRARGYVIPRADG